MKAVQIDKTFESVEIDAPVAGEGVQVSGYGPQTVAVQLSIADSVSPGTASGQLQGSIDGTNFFNVGSPVTISADGELAIKDVDVAYAVYRVNYAIASGSFAVVERWFVYGDRA